jgi:serine/threonine protein phosphatase PrpC
LLSDGLGGHGKGDLASKFVVSQFARTFETLAAAVGEREDREAPDLADMLARCFQDSQDALLAEQARLGCMNEMKATLVALCVSGSRARWGHIGDSRLYRFAKNKIAERTLDHSVPQMLVASGEIREKDIRFHEDRSRLLRVMGTEWNSPKYEISPEAAISRGDGFLLCSDGFWEQVREKDMANQRKRSESAREWLESMEKIAVLQGKSGSMDNYSAVAVIV